MIIRESGEFDQERGGLFDADYTADSIAELEQQHEAGEIDTRAYLIKKNALVRLYLKATTTPKRKPPPWDDCPEDVS